VKRGNRMESLGWSVWNHDADYKLSLPHMSSEEKEVVLAVASRFLALAQRLEIADDGAARDEITKLLSVYLCECRIDADHDQHKYLSDAVFLQTFGLGFLGELLLDESLEEIAVIGLGKPVFVFVRGHGWKRTNVSIDSQEYFVSLANRLGRGLGRRLTSQQPRLNATLSDGSRLHATMPPISSCELTIRKFSRDPLSPFDLMAYGTWGARELSLLSLALQSDLSVLFCGNTASGKTSTLNALLSFVPSSERLLLIEETPEISVPHPHQLRMVPFEEGNIGMVELVRDSLRMRPDKVAVGEIRSSDEARAFAESALSGQAKGCYATFHAQTSRDAVLRLRMMGCLEADLEGLDLFVVQRRFTTYDSKKRKIGESRRLSEISIADRHDVLNPIRIFDNGKFSKKGLDILLARISLASGMPGLEVRKELSRREGFLGKGQRGKRATFSDSFQKIQEYMFGKIG